MPQRLLAPSIWLSTSELHAVSGTVIALGEKRRDVGIYRNCPYCLSEICEIIYSGNSIPTNAQVSTVGFNLVRCRKCKTIYVNPAPAPETLMMYYPADYYGPNARVVPAVFEAVTRMRSFLHQQIKHWLSQGKSFPGKRVLEVGCANGDNLDLFLEAGWKVSAVEPNPRLAAVAAAKGIHVHVGFVDSVKWDRGQFDIILLNHVLEHDYSPRRILGRCVHALKADGLLYVEIPIVESLSWYLFGRHWGELEFPIHLTFLRKEHLMSLLGEFGCRPVKWKTRTMYGEILRAFQHKFPVVKEASGLGRVAFLAFATMLQGAFVAVNILLRRGEAFSIVARCEST